MRVRRYDVRTCPTRRLAKLQPTVRRRATQLVVGLPHDMAVDLVPRLTHPLPTQTIFRLLGYRGHDAERVESCSNAWLDLFWRQLEPPAQVRVARQIVE
jgi:cytochrome P450